MPLQCMHVRIGYDTPCEMSSTFLRAWIVLGMMISLYVVFRDQGEIDKCFGERYLIREIIPHRRRQGVI